MQDLFLSLFHPLKTLPDSFERGFNWIFLDLICYFLFTTSGNKVKQAKLHKLNLRKMLFIVGTRPTGSEEQIFIGHEHGSSWWDTAQHRTGHRKTIYWMTLFLTLSHNKWITWSNKWRVDQNQHRTISDQLLYKTETTQSGGRRMCSTWNINGNKSQNCQHWFSWIYSPHFLLLCHNNNHSTWI